MLNERLLLRTTQNFCSCEIIVKDSSKLFRKLKKFFEFPNAKEIQKLRFYK